MIDYKFKKYPDESEYELIGKGFEKLADTNDVVCNYQPFTFTAEVEGLMVGIITGKSYYKEVNIEDLIVKENYRHEGIGKGLIEQVEEYFKDKDFENINLTTYEFQAVEFYKKQGYEIEYMRPSRTNAKLNKYFMIKYL